MGQMALILAVVILYLGCLQYAADAQQLFDKSLLEESFATPPAPPEEEQKVDFSGEVNAILEGNMVLGSQAASNASADEMEQPELPIKTDVSTLEEKKSTPLASINSMPNNATSNNATSSNSIYGNMMSYNATSNNTTFVELKPLQPTDKKANSVTYSIGICYSTILDKFLVDSNGTTLYYFKGDLRGNGIARCTGSCLEIWRPFYIPAIIVMPWLNQSDFTTFTGENGLKQIAYKGWPLYHFEYDTMPGEANGQGIDGAWFVVNPEDFPPR